jgi:hypothetical protein
MRSLIRAANLALQAARCGRRHGGWPRACAASLAALLAVVLPARAEDLPEYRIKAAFVYNFALFTEWPAEVGPVLNLCILGVDPFGKEADNLQGKTVGRRHIAVRRISGRDPVNGCQLLFIAQSAIGGLPRVLEGLRGSQVLTVADSPDGAQQGVAINMTSDQPKISFEVNLKAARSAGLNLSSKLLRLATEVHQ